MERISEMFPTVEQICIEYRRKYLSAIIGLRTDSEFIKSMRLPDFSCFFEIECLNDDCTQGYYDLFSVISSMVAHKETSREGVVKCGGRESRKYTHSCPSEMEYRITIEYKERIQ